MKGDWHPVAASAALVPGGLLAAQLFGQELVLWRDAQGVAKAWEDRCPHRGTRLSMGEVQGGALVCRYHGWRFGADGACLHVPSQPEAPLPAATVTSFAVAERHGLVWACIGEPAFAAPPSFPEYDDPNLRTVICGPYAVAASGPRIVENFLDMAHFPTIHAGILGDSAHTGVRDYVVDAFDDGEGGQGSIATGCVFWQPRSNIAARGGGDVEYTYRFVRPLTAILTKLPRTQQGFREAISLHVQPLGEEHSRVWIILAMTAHGQSDEQLRAFQDRVFEQDRPVLENQRPKLLPLAERAEVSVRCDRLSLAYRRYLRELGVDFGTIV